MIQLTRKEDWPLRFTEFLVESQQEGLRCDWETMHCALWGALCVEELTGEDIYAPFRQFEVTTPEEAYLAIKRGGYNSIEEYLDSILPQKELAWARRGDLILAPADQVSELTAQELKAFPSAVAIADPPFYWALGAEGIGRAPLDTALKCYGVGN